MIYPILIGSGILCALSTMFKYSGFLAFFALIPYIYIIFKKAHEKRNPFRYILYGFTFSFPFFLTIYHWFWYLYPMEFLGFSKAAAFFSCLFFQIGLSLLQAISYSLMPLLFRIISEKGKKALYPVIFALIFAVMEFLQTLTWMGVPWARLALSQTSFLPMAQTSSLFGSIFVSFVIVLINGYLALAVYEYTEREQNKNEKSKFRIRSYALMALAVFLFNTGLGLIIMPKKNGEPIRYALIQSNIGSGDKWEGDIYDALDLSIEMTEEACKNGDIDIVVWSETTLTYALNRSQSSIRALTELSEKTGAVIIAGTFTDEKDDDGDILSYNALVAFKPDGSFENIGYVKRHLVPFGEYLPNRKLILTLLPFLGDINMLSDDLTPGTDSEILETEFGKVGRLICFDSIYPRLALDASRDGAEIIVLSTNDSWYRDSTSAYQHNSHAVLRAIENNKWILRCATTGISSAISGKGEVTNSIEPLVNGYITGEAYTNTSRTPYSYIGDIFIYLSNATLVVLFVVKCVRIKKNKKNDQ